ncbi:peptidase A22B, signal peptide peptidase, partial [Kipferlia bialata]|eukprot:g11831.t1
MISTIPSDDEPALYPAPAMSTVTTGTYAAFGGLSLMALISVHMGSRKAATPLSQSRAENVETIDKEAASKLFAFSTVMLVGLFAMIKYLPKEYLSIGMKVYFGGVTLITGSAMLEDILLMGADIHTHTVAKDKKEGEEDKAPVPFLQRLVLGVHTKWFSLDLYMARLIGGLITVPVLALFYLTNNWMLGNLMSMALCVFSIDTVRADKLIVAVGFLWAYFVYDIVFVYFTPIMVSVAKGIDLPIKLLCPKTLAGLLMHSPPNAAMLGLGDIVLPGVLLSYLKRMDTEVKKETEARTEGETESEGETEVKAAAPLPALYPIAFKAYTLALVSAITVLLVS